MSLKAQISYLQPKIWAKYKAKRRQIDFPNNLIIFDKNLTHLGDFQVNFHILALKSFWLWLKISAILKNFREQCSRARTFSHVWTKLKKKLIHKYLKCNFYF